MPYKNKATLYKKQIERWKMRKIKAIAYKGGVCLDCQKLPHINAMAFHHRNPSEKLFTWNKLRLLKWDAVLNELDKCDLLCANCHAIRHAALSN